MVRQNVILFKLLLILVKTSIVEFFVWGSKRTYREFAVIHC